MRFGPHIGGGGGGDLKGSILTHCGSIDQVYCWFTLMVDYTMLTRSCYHAYSLIGL